MISCTVCLNALLCPGWKTIEVDLREGVLTKSRFRGMRRMKLGVNAARDCPKFEHTIKETTQSE